MTITSTTARNTYTLNGATVIYPYGFRVFAAVDLQVIMRSAGTGVETVLNYPADFAVSGVGNTSGGSVTLVSAGTNGDTLTIRRNTALTQATDLANQGRYAPADTEAALDRLTAIDQQQQDQIDRSLRLAASVDPAVVSTRLPYPQANAALVWDGAAAALTNRLLDSSLNVALPGNGRTITTLTQYLDNNKITNVLDYGATSDAKVIYDIAIASGTPTLTSASAGFTAADVGKVMLVAGAGPAGVRLATTILSYQSATQVTLATNASTTILSTPASNAAYGTDSTIKLQNALNAAPAGTILWLNGAFLITSGLTITKKLRIVGAAMGDGGGSAVVLGSRIMGSGFTLVAVSQTFSFDSIQITDPVGHASTIALDVNNGATGVVNSEARNCYFTGNHNVKLGTGVRLLFALKNAFPGCFFEGWNFGVDFQNSGLNHSNANSFPYCKIRVNAVGLNMAVVDDVFVSFSTIEGNATGVEHLSGLFASSHNHYENNVAPQRNIHTTGTGTIASFADGFYSSGADLDVYIESGAGKHTFLGTVFNAGLKHNGTGVVSIFNPVNAVAVAGTGPIVQITGVATTALQGLSGAQYTLGSGFSLVAIATNALVNAGADANTTLTLGNGGGAPTAGRNIALALNSPSSGGFLGGANVRYQRNSVELWNVGINSAIAGAKTGTNDYYWLDSVGGSYVAALSTLGDFTVVRDLVAGVVGGGLRVKEGANAKMGTAVLVGGTLVVNTTKVTASSRIFLTTNVPGGAPGWLQVSARTPGTSFTILSSSGTDTSTVAWTIVEPAP